MICSKCKTPGTILLRKKDSYCNSCFLTNTNHKFRASIGKNKVLSANGNVLICLSGGVGSTVLLDLIHNATTLDSHKKLRVIPFFFHLLETARSNQIAEAMKLIEKCLKTNINVYVTRISEYMQATSTLPEINCIPPHNDDRESEFQALIGSMPSTACNDLRQKIKVSLFIRFAKLLKCNFIFTAETTATLAINLLSNVALGRGSQIQNDVGFCDTRDNVKILRPMKDITKEELDNYMYIKQLIPQCSDGVQVNSLQSVIGSFVTELQESFQATISTVCKTADKIGVQNDNRNLGICIICKSKLDRKESKLTALGATNFSRMVSESPQNGDISEHLEILEGQDVHITMFPFIHEQLCYGCSRNYSEMKNFNLPSHVQKLLQS